jgi:hypothetical protein
MPQLDFFTFPHQYLITTSCLIGLYYFNLLFLFPRLKHFHLNRFFTFKAYHINEIMCLWDYLSVFTDLFQTDIILFNYFFKKKNRRLQKKTFLFKKTSNVFKMIKTQTLSNYLFTLSLVFFLLIFVFFKNFISFNAEKLMTIYFLVIIISLTIYLIFLFNNFLKIHMSNILEFISKLELDVQETLSLTYEYYNKIIIDLGKNQFLLLLLKIYEIKLVKKIK